MGFMGMGWQEIAIIVIIGIIIFGPDKLPEMAGQAGKLLRDFRRMTTEMSGEFEKQTGVSVQELKRNVDREIAGFKSEVAGTTASVKSSVNKTATSVGKTVSSATSKTSAAAKSGTTAKSTTATATKASTSSAKTSTTAAKTAAAAPVKASKADPLADVSIFENTGSSPVNGGPKTAGAGAGSAASLVGAGAARSTGDPSADRADAIARARLRRHSAGYQINPPSPN